MEKKSIGNWGENMACKHILDLGYKIIERNYHCRNGEIDIIALDKTTIVFIEVKTRKNNLYGNASEFVDYKKRQKIIYTANYYMMNRPDTDARFDIIEVYYYEENEQKHLKSINHIENAFIT